MGRRCVATEAPQPEGVSRTAVSGRQKIRPYGASLAKELQVKMLRPVVASQCDRTPRRAEHWVVMPRFSNWADESGRKSEESTMQVVRLHSCPVLTRGAAKKLGEVSSVNQTNTICQHVKKGTMTSVSE